MKKNTIHIILLLLMPFFSGQSQTNAFSDQYLSNLFLLNPAVAGTGRYAQLSVQSRQQWVGWDGAPASQSVTFQSRVARSKNRFTPFGFVNKGRNTYSNVGAGGGFFHESYGVFGITGFHLDYSYNMFIGDGRLSFGLSPSFFQVGTTSIIMTDPNDPYLSNPNKSYFVDFNAGMHYFTKEGYAGFSLVQLANSSVQFGNYGYPGLEEPSLNPDLARSMYAYGGYFFTLSRELNLKVEPMGLIMLNGSGGFRFDVSTTVHLRDMFNAGVQYRYNRGISIFAGARLDNLSIRYLFEIPVSADIPGRFTSHTIQLSMNLGQPLD